MATFSQYGVGGFSGGTIAADESYIGALGAFQMMEESAQNERAVFEFVLGCDFAEAATNNGVMTESEFEAINEASTGGIFSKVVDFFKKMAAKIKGIFKNVIDKINAMCTKDGKELVRKFDKQINEKLNNGEYNDDKFSYKWCEVNDFDFDYVKMYMTKIKCTNAVNDNDIYQAMVGARQLKKFIDSGVDDDADKKDLDDYNKSDDSKALTSDELKDYKDAALSSLLGESTEASTFANDVDEKSFESEDTIEGLTSSRIDECVKVLKGADKCIRDLEKQQTTTEKYIRDKFIKPAENIEKELKNRSRNNSKNYGAASAAARSLAQCVISMGNVLTSCSGMAVTANIAAVKKYYKQCRALYIKAATYTKKRAKNEATLLEAYVDVSNNEVDEMMPEC